MKVSDLIEKLKDLPQDSTIGTITYDADKDSFEGDNILLLTKHEANMNYGVHNLDFYLV